MKPLQFTIPVTSGETVIVQEDIIPQFYSYLHRHKEAQLVWILKGKGTVIVDNSMHLFQPNDIFMIAPNQSHVFKSELDANEGVHSLAIYFDLNGQLKKILDLPEFKTAEIFFQEFKGGFRLPANQFLEVSKRMQAIQRTRNIPQVILFLDLIQYLCTMDPPPSSLSQLASDPIAEGEGLRMGNIVNYISHHFKREITLDEIANEVYLTPQAFCRYFKKHTGVTFITFLNQIRVNEACKTLIDGDFDSMSTIAYRCGFNSITNFNRVFKNIIGDSPKGYLVRYFKNVNG